jgi:hypothetical protein
MWVVFDLFLVAQGIVTKYLLTAMLSLISNNESLREDAANFLILRLFRLGRLARTVRLLAQFKDVWMLVRGIISSAGTMVYVFFLFSLIVYVFACMSVELITKPQLALSDEEREANIVYDDIINTHWDSLPKTMLTLFQFIPWPLASIFLPMCRHKPHLFMFFCSYLLLVSVCLMNLVTAVIVERSLTQAAQDKHIAKLHRASIVDKLMPKYKAMFKDLDTDGDGKITLEEFGACDDAVRDELCELFNTEDFIELFEMLDADGGGTVTIDEFCDEMVKLSTTVESVEHLRTMKQMQLIRTDVLDNSHTTSQLMKMMYGISEQLRNGGIPPTPNTGASPSPYGSNPLEKRISAVEDKIASMDKTLTQIKMGMRFDI